MCLIGLCVGTQVGAPIAAQESGRWVRSLEFAVAPVTGEKVSLIVQLAPVFNEVTDHVRVEGVSLEEDEPHLVQEVAVAVGDRFAARLTFPEPGLWLVSLTRVWIEALQDAEVLTVPVYVAAKTGMVADAWMDSRMADVLRQWPSQSGGSDRRTPVQLADWQVKDISVEGSPFGVAVVGREALITWGLVGGQQWRAIEGQALSLTEPEYLMVKFFPTGSREAAWQVRAEPSGPWSYSLKITLAEEGVWRMVPRAVVNGSETRWPNKGAMLQVHESLPPQPQEDADPRVSAEAPSLTSTRFLPGWVPSVLWASLGGSLALFLAYRLLKGRGLEE